MMACQIVPYRVEARGVECKTASDWFLLGLLRRCDILRTATINTSLIPSIEVDTFLRAPNATLGIPP